MLQHASQKTLLLQVQISRLAQNIPSRVLTLLIFHRVPRIFGQLLLQLCVQLQGIGNLRDPVKVVRVGNLQALHAVDMPRLLKVAVEFAVTPIRVVPAYLTLEAFAQAVQAVQPVRNGLPVPAQAYPSSR